MVYQINQIHNDTGHSELEINEVKQNDSRMQIGLSKSRSRSTGRPKVSKMGSSDLSMRRSFSRSTPESAESRELKSKKTTETKKRSKSLNGKRSARQPRSLGITVNMTNSFSVTERNRIARERTRKDKSVRTRALSLDRPQTRRKHSSDKRSLLDRGRSRRPSTPNSKVFPSTSDELMYKTQDEKEKETSMVISSIQPSDSTTGIPISDDSSGNQLGSDILIREKISKATASSCNAIDSAMLSAESSLATVAFSCSDKLQDLIAVLPKAMSFLFKKDNNNEEKGTNSIPDIEGEAQEMVAEKEEREDEITRELDDGESDTRDDIERRDDEDDGVGYIDSSSSLVVTDKPFMYV